jgi:hypothetical protein
MPEKNQENENWEDWGAPVRADSQHHATTTTQTREVITTTPYNPLPPPQCRMNVIKLATFNMNGTTAQMRVEMLADLVRWHDFDILFVQEVTSTEVLNVRGYETHLNIGTSLCGTDILAIHELHLTTITTLPSSHATAAVYKGIQLINVYAPSGTARRTDRERFFSTELPCLFQADQKQMITGMISTEFCTPTDTTGHFLPSQALMKIAADSPYRILGTKTHPNLHTHTTHLIEPP